MEHGEAQGDHIVSGVGEKLEDGDTLEGGAMLVW